MSEPPGPADRWARLRYGRLLPLAARRRAFGRGYADLVGRIELWRDAARCQVATARIARSLGVAEAAARSIFLTALRSEAREEADSAFFMSHPGALDVSPCSPPTELASGPAILGTLHFGSPVIGYLLLRRRFSRDVSIIGRPLDETNPMPAAKAAFARNKVAWTERLAARPFLSTDAPSIARAREHLLAGGQLYTPIDVPGDVTARNQAVELFGQSLRFASGIERLARLTGCPIQPIVTLARSRGFELWCGRRIEGGAGEDALGAALAELEGAIRRDPGEWWLWPYLVDANGRDPAARP